MTREEAKKIFGELLLFGKAPCKKEELEDLCKIVLAALEQKPVLDKIRTEIEELDYITFDGITKKRCLEIIDKYKAEAEAEDGNN